jgi:hypothetical protein
MSELKWPCEDCSQLIEGGDKLACKQWGDKLFLCPLLRDWANIVVEVMDNDEGPSN